MRDVKCAPLNNHQPAPITDTLHDPLQIAPPQPDTPRCRIPRPAPLMDKYRRAPPPHSPRPVPIGDQHHVIHRIGPAQHLVAVWIGHADHQVIILIAHIIRPQVPRPDRHRPFDRFRHPIRPVQKSHKVMHPARRATIALALGIHHTAPPHRAGKPPPGKPQARRRYNQIHALHKPGP